jgi:hypothetical protein
MRTKLIVFVAGLIITVICSLLFCLTLVGFGDNIPVDIKKTKRTFPAPLTTNGIFNIRKPCDMKIIGNGTVIPIVLADIVEEPIIIVPIKRTFSNSIPGDCLQYLDIIDDYDWPVEEALQICKGESHGNTTAVGDRNTSRVSCGIFQIRIYSGRPTCEELKNPELNIQWAYKLWLQSGWRPWYNAAKELGLL